MTIPVIPPPKQELLNGAPTIITVPNLLTNAECEEWRNEIDRRKPKVAPITTRRGPVMNLDARNNERAMFDDVERARLLFEKVAKHIPARLGNMRACGANERLRCYRYKAGMHFRPHFDGSFVRSGTEHSCYTLLVYLNDDFVGGETVFHAPNPGAIRPKVGMALLFLHRQLHEGAEVKEGVKYVLRSDIMYKMESDHPV